MPTNVDLKSLGEALKRARLAKDLTQEQLIDGLDSYGDVRNLRRHESGERRPKRKTIIEIMVVGLGETSAQKVNELLQMADYAALTRKEATKLGLTQPPETPAQFSVLLTNPSSVVIEPDQILTDRQALVAFGVPVLLVAAATVAFIYLRIAPTWFAVVTSGLYASLYAVSILLETAYRAAKLRVYWAAMLIFCFIFLSSALGLGLDAQAIERGATDSLWWTLLAFFGSGAVQWFWVRSVLPTASIVPAKFQTMTAQAAHLKNTAYCLLIVVLFWIVPFHSVASLGHLMGTHHTQIVRQILTSAEPFIGTSFVFVKPLWLWGLGLLLVGFSVPMASHLTDSLEAGHGHNRFLALFYGRAIIYFVLCFLCLLWYSVAVSQLSSVLSSTSAARSPKSFYEAGN